MRNEYSVEAFGGERFEVKLAYIKVDLQMRY